MASTPSPKVPGNRMFVLALGLLLGFVIGFVMLLSRLPVDGALHDFSVSDMRQDPANGSGYQFYTVLEDQTVGPSVRNEPAESPVNVVITPATRVVPGNVQNISARNLAVEGYAEIPASSLGQESYYLQAGNFRRPGDAEQARAAVLLLGLEAFIVVREDSDGTLGHRVRIGPFFDQVKVSDAKQRLQRGGINYKLIRVTG